VLNIIKVIPDCIDSKKYLFLKNKKGEAHIRFCNFFNCYLLCAAGFIIVAAC